MRDRGFGWDLPPGVSVNSIPGNRSEDELQDAFWRAFDEKLTEADISTITIMGGSRSGKRLPLGDIWDSVEFVKIIEAARDLGYNLGYNDGRGEADVAQTELEEAVSGLQAITRDLTIISNSTLKTFVISTMFGERQWMAQDERHAIEQHEDAFPDEKINWIKRQIR